jgi:cysteine desulfurase
MKNTATYLDYNATTPCAPEVIEAMIPFFGSMFANPASPHVMGREVARAVEVARHEVACAIGVDAVDIVFTSGATESNNMVFGSLPARSQTRHRIVVSAGEHKSVLEPCRWMSERGVDVVQIPLTRSGTADVAAAEELIDDDTLIVSIQGANNETGVLQPIKAIAEIAHSHGALLHCDAAQMPGKVHVALEDIGVDIASISAHKLYGPKGIGALFIRQGEAKALISPLFRGGGQEAGLRPGTLNVPAIVGFGKACQIIPRYLDEEMERTRCLRDEFEAKILAIVPDAFVVGAKAPRLPGTSDFCFMDVPADVLLARATNICISGGSACNSGAVSPSHVVLACGYSRDVARCVVRISLGRYTTKDEVDRAAEHLAKCVKVIRDNVIPT